MARKSTYEELEQRVKELERKVYELMEAEGALRNKEEMVRALLTATTDSVFLTDLDGIIIASNKLAAQRFGKNMNEFTGKCVWDFLPLELAKTKKAHIDDLIRSGKPAYYEEERKAHFFYYSIYPVLDARGKVERIAFFARDVTKRKQAEEVLRESEEKYRNILESIEDGYFEVDIA